MNKGFWEILQERADSKGVTLTKIISDLGLSSSSFYDKKKKNELPKDDVMKALSNYFGVDFPIQGDTQYTVKMIPFYDAVAVGGSDMLASQDAISKPTEMINPGTWFKTAQGSLRVYGHSMFPKYPSGSIIAFKNGTDMRIIHYGEDYVIELEDRRIVKRVQKSREKGCIQVNSYNSMKDDVGAMVYAPYDIPMDAIKRMYMVLGKVELEASV